MPAVWKPGGNGARSASGRIPDGTTTWSKTGPVTTTGDFRFLYDYGYALHKTGSYRQSNEILREGMRISSDPMFWNIAGRNYEMLGDVAAAELAYLHAHRMIPDRVYPLYLLAKLYLADGQTEKAFATACRVIAHKPKVESVQTREMQAELRKLLEMPPSGEIRE